MKLEIEKAENGYIIKDPSGKKWVFETTQAFFQKLQELLN